MPGAFNAGIVYRLSPRTRGLSMLRPGTAPAKHYLLPGPLSLTRPLRAKTSIRTPVQCQPREPPARFHQDPPAATIIAVVSTQLNAVSDPQWIGSTKYSTVGRAAPMTRS